MPDMVQVKQNSRTTLIVGVVVLFMSGPLGSIASGLSLVALLVGAVLIYLGFRAPKKAQGDWEGESARGEAEYQAAYAAWRDAVIRDEEQTVTAWSRAPRFYPVLVPASRIDIIGGTRFGWATVLQGSLLPRIVDGHPALVLDLTGIDATGGLREAVPPHISTDVVRVPWDFDRLEPLGDPTTAAGTLADFLDASGAPSTEAALERRILTQILECLEGPTTVRRVHAAMTAIQAPGAPEVRSSLSEAERNSLQDPDLLATLERAGIGRLPYLQGALDPLLRSAERTGTGTTPIYDELAQLTVLANVSTDPRLAPGITGLLVGAVIRRAAQFAGRTVVVLGAERVGSGSLRLLVQAAEASRIPLWLFFADLRGEAKDAVGRSSGATIVMSLGHADDAAAAANLFGAKPKMVIGSATKQLGSSITDTQGDSLAWTRGESGDDKSSGGWNQSTQTSQSWSRAWGSTDSYSETSQRVVEAEFSAYEITRLNATVAVVTARTASGELATVVCDCNPAIEMGQLTSAQPLPR